MKSIRFNRRLSDGSTYLLGVAVEREAGWRFISNVASHKNSRKDHAMYVDCIPRWVGFPNKCETEWIGFEEDNMRKNCELAEALFDWFRSQGCEPSDAINVMEIAMASLIKVEARHNGVSEEDVLGLIGRHIAMNMLDMEPDA